jgi:hypothetical protein
MTFRDTDGNELIFNGDFAMTKQSVSIFSGTIKGDVSITFQLDNNSTNRKILNYSGPQMANQVAFTRQTFSRINKGNLIDQGYIVIQSEDSDYLNCFYVSGNSNWLQLFSRLITELDYSGVTNGKAYTRQFTSTNVRSSQTEGITFPFIDWCFNLNKGNNYYDEGFTGRWLTIDDDSTLPIIQFYPCFFMHSLVSEILSQSDVKKDGNLFRDGLYTSLAVTPVDGQMKRAPFKKVLLNGSSVTYSAGVGVFEKVTGLTLRQGDSSSWDNINKRFTCPILTSRYLAVTMTSGTATSIQVKKNGSRNSSGISVTLGIKQTIDLGNAISGSESVGDYYEVYVTSSASPYSAAFDLEFYLPEEILQDDYIDPSNFLPPLQSIDILKFLINYFGCSVYFDSTSKTLSLNIIERMKLEDAYDWSEYYIGHSSYYIDNVANHNYINWADTEDNTIVKYNRLHSLKFAAGDLQTDNTLLSEREICQLPFAPISSGLSFNGSYLLNIPLINLVDDGDPILFTGIGLSAAGPPVRSFFTTGVPGVLNTDEVVRITNGDGDDLGYYKTFISGSPTGETIVFPFTSTDTGKIWRQKIEYQTIEPRVVAVKPSVNSTEFSQSALFGTSATQFSASPYATFTKNVTSLPIDQWRNNLAIENPDSGNFIDPTIKDLYFNKINKFINNPRIRTIMLLPESVYQRFKFDQFIYIKTEKLTGYFFVDVITNYVDGKTPVEITLYML